MVTRGQSESKLKTAFVGSQSELSHINYSTNKTEAWLPFSTGNMGYKAVHFVSFRNDSYCNQICNCEQNIHDTRVLIMLSRTHRHAAVCLVLF